MIEATQAMTTNRESQQADGQLEAAPTTDMSRRWNASARDDDATGRSAQEAAIEQGLARQNVHVLRPGAVPTDGRLRQHGPLLLAIVGGALLILLLVLGITLG